MELLTERVDAVLLPVPVVQRLAKEAELDGRIAFFGAPLASATRHVALHENRASLLGPINAAIATLEADGRLEQLRVRYNLALPPAAPDVLSVGVTDFPPYNIIGEDGSFSGFAVESLRALADRAGLAIDFQPITNEEFAAGPSLTTYDMLPQAGVTEARSQIMDFTLPLEQFDFTIFTLTNEAEGLTDLDSLGSRKVGVEAVNSARPIAERHGGLNLSVYYGRDSLLKALLNGEVEAILFPAVPMKEEIREQGAIGLVKAVTPPFRVIERAPALRHGLGTVRDALNVVIPGYLISDDYAALRQEYFGEPIFWTSTRIYGAGGTIGACMLLLSGYLFVHRQRRRAREFAMQQQSLAQEKAHSEKLALLVTDLEHSNRELDEFAYIASHDLKEPLRGIGINANFLLREKLPDAARVRALRMIELTTRMEQLISDLLFFSRIGRDVTSRVAVQPGQLIAAIRSDLSEWLAERGGEIVEIGQIPTLQAERLKVKTVLQNLCVNGIKYNDKDKKIVEIGFLPRVEIRGSVLQNAIFVRDNGIGIDEKNHDKVFRIFSRLNKRADYPSDDVDTGTGSGLAFVRKIIEQHGGTIDFDSVKGRGSTFYFTLPLASPKDNHTVEKGDQN